MLTVATRIYILGVVLFTLFGLYLNIGGHTFEWIGLFLAAVLWPVVLVRILTPGTVDRKL